MLGKAEIAACKKNKAKDKSRNFEFICTSREGKGNINIIGHGKFLRISFYERVRAFVNRGEDVDVITPCFIVAFDKATSYLCR